MAVVRAVVNAFTTAAATLVPAPIVPVLTGTLTCVAGTKLVTGTGTAFLTELTRYKATTNPDGKNSLLGQFLDINDTSIEEIDYVINDTIMYLKNPHISGFSGATCRAVNAQLIDCELVGDAKTIIMPGGNILTPASSVPLVLKKNNAGVVPPFIAPSGVGVACSQPFEYYKP